MIISFNTLLNDTKAKLLLILKMSHCNDLHCGWIECSDLIGDNF